MTRRQKAIAFFVALCVLLVAAALSLNIGWIIANANRITPLILGVVLFGLIIAGLIVYTVFLVLEIKRNEEHDTFILEDDAYGELRFEGEPKPSLYALDTRGRVIRAGTLSKILGAGVRLGWLCAPAALIPVLQSFNYGGGVNPFMSRVATYYLRDHMEEHVKRLIEVYRTKRDAMLRGLWEVLKGTDVEIRRPEGGFFIWIRLPSGTDPKRLQELADDLKEHVTKKIGAIARPDDILFSADLPKTRSGKIMRRLLRDIAEGKALGDTTTLADPGVVARLKEMYEGQEG